jgi:hypothetical protein
MSESVLKLSETIERQSIVGDENIPFFANNNNGFFPVSAVKTYITKQDIGLGNADNTSDLDKPISLLTQAALANKANTTHSHYISEVNNFSEV